MIISQCDFFPGTREAAAFHTPGHQGFFSINWRNPETKAEARRLHDLQLSLADLIGHGTGGDVRQPLMLGETQSLFDGAASVEERIAQLYATVKGKSPHPVRQQCLPITMLPRALDALVNRPGFEITDFWISQNGFSQKNRRASCVLHLNMLFVDIDIRTIGGPGHWLAGMAPDAAANCFVRWCHDHDIPEPSIIVWSGNGLHAKWFFSTSAPRLAKPAWDALQLHLIARLKADDWPVDERARDVSRILRVPGTFNQKGGELCEIVWESGNGPDAWVRYDFNELMDGKKILPWTRAEARERREIGKVWDANRKLARAGVIELLTRPNISVGCYLEAELWHGRLSAIRRLAEIRYGTAGVPEGQRNTFVWMAANALAWSAGGADAYYRDLLPVVRELVSSFTHAEVLSSASAVNRRVKEQFGQNTGLYKMTNVRFREILDIRTDEAVQLFAGHQPHPEWDIGVMGFEPMANLPFAQYQAETQRRQVEAAVRTNEVRKTVGRKKGSGKQNKLMPQVLAMLANGHSHRAIAAALGVSQPTISAWIIEHEK